MDKWGKIRIIIFSAVLIAVLFSGVYATNNQACPLQGDGFTFKTTASPTTFDDISQEITFSYHIKNTSAYFLEEIEIKDDLVNNIKCPKTMLKPKEDMICQGSYLTTQEDIDNREVTNLAKFSATGYIDGSKHEDGSAKGCNEVDNCCSLSSDLVPVERKGSDGFAVVYEKTELNLEKIGSQAIFYSSGELINYTYIVTNTGSVDFEDFITIADDMVEVICPESGLDVGQEMECSASYTTTDNDLAIGHIKNTAIATAGEISSKEVSFSVEYLPPPLTLTKTGKVHIYSIVEDLLSYVFIITNDGRGPVSGPFNFEDPMLDQLICDFPNTLNPGASYQCEGYYRVRESDLGGTVRNCASISYYYEGNKFTSEGCFDVDYYPPDPDPKKETGGDPPDSPPDPDA